MQLQAAFKLKLVEYAQRHRNRCACREFDECEKLIRDWRKKKAELQSLPGSRRSQRPVIKPYWPESEDKLNYWVLEKRHNGIGLSGMMVRLKAKGIAREQPEICQNFTGSTTWLYRFINRKKLSIRQKTKIAQRLPEACEQEIVRFQQLIIQMRKCNVYEMSQIGNMDETPMNFDMPATHTVHPIGEKTVIMKTTGNV